MGRNKDEIITFKVDRALKEALDAMPNRSQFIRAAILTALENLCPLCGGTGQLSPEQWDHWQEFAVQHALEKCDHCHQYHLVCQYEHVPPTDAVESS